MNKTLQTSSSISRLNIKLPAVAAGQSIGLLGGSFNPAHEGHLNISLQALKRLGLDHIWWLVSPGNPLKSHDELASLATRLEAARQLTSDRRIIVTDFERRLPTSYTASTLEFLTSRFKGTNFVWLMGADNLAGIHLWKNWRTIFDLVPIAVFDRPGYRHKAHASLAAQKFSAAHIDESQAPGLALMPPPAWTFLTIPLNPTSSTELRKA